jgi:hypothetical protein
MITGRMGKISVFCSYAREDESHRGKLEEHLRPLRAEKIIDDWYDDRIQPGARWDAEIGSALDGARLVLFIVTPDLLASRYVRDVELPKSLELERRGRCQIVPIVARETDWGDSPLAEFQALPRDARPIESYSDADVAYAEIAAGLKEVCKRIVDWENPYKRAQVGDWTHSEQTTTLSNGQSVTVEVTLEVVKKTSRKAVVQVEGVGGGEQMNQTLTIDLAEPLEDRMGDFMDQLGEALPANAEVRIGPSRYEEEVLLIGGKRYETIKATRDITFAQQDWEQKGSASTWRCIDVPLDGIVKGTSELQVVRQNSVLLDYGHKDAAARKPKLAEKAPPPPLVGPGHWRIQISVFGVGSSFDVFLHPNGTLESTQTMMGFAAQLQGQWGFDGNSNTLTLQIVTMMMGMPTAQDLIQMQITGRDGALLQGADAMGRQFVLQRLY